MKLTKFTTPTGVKGDISNPWDVWGLVLGFFVLVVTSIIGQKILKQVDNAVPGNQGKLDPVFNQPVQAVATKTGGVIY